jgi:hypothetical protein
VSACKEMQLSWDEQPSCAMMGSYGHRYGEMFRGADKSYALHEGKKPAAVHGVMGIPAGKRRELAEMGAQFVA